MTFKVAIIGGRPADGTILPRKEGAVWEELKRILALQLKDPFYQQCEFLIPVYSKFDLEVMRLCEEYQYPVTLYVPNSEWGLQKLPLHQTRLIKRMNPPRVIHQTERINRMMEDADMVLFLEGSQGIDTFQRLNTKPSTRFFARRMRYRTETEYNAYISQLTMTVL